MYKNSFLKLFILILVVLCFSASSCGGDSDKTYLDGTYMNDKLNVGYIFFPDGRGYQFISKDHFLIEYGISDGIITITTLVEDTEVTQSFPFEQSGDDIIIDGVTYTLVPDDTSGIPDLVSESVSENVSVSSD